MPHASGTATSQGTFAPEEETSSRAPHTSVTRAHPSVSTTAQRAWQSIGGAAVGDPLDPLPGAGADPPEPLGGGGALLAVPGSGSVGFGALDVPDAVEPPDPSSPEVGATGAAPAVSPGAADLGIAGRSSGGNGPDPDAHAGQSSPAIINHRRDMGTPRWRLDERAPRGLRRVDVSALRWLGDKPPELWSYRYGRARQNHQGFLDDAASAPIA